MQQHVLDDGVSALAVLDDLAEIVFKQSGQLVRLLAAFVSQPFLRQNLIQLLGQFDQKGGKIVHEVQWVLDLVRNTGSELAEGSKLFGLYEAILRGAEVVE